MREEHVGGRCVIRFLGLSRARSSTLHVRYVRYLLTPGGETAPFWPLQRMNSPTAVLVLLLFGSALSIWTNSNANVGQVKFLRLTPVGENWLFLASSPYERQAFGSTFIARSNRGVNRLLSRSISLSVNNTDRPLGAQTKTSALFRQPRLSQFGVQSSAREPLASAPLLLLIMASPLCAFYFPPFDSSAPSVCTK